MIEQLIHTGGEKRRKKRQKKTNLTVLNGACGGKWILIAKQNMQKRTQQLVGVPLELKNARRVV